MCTVPGLTLYRHALFTPTEADALLKQWGRNELVEKRTPSWMVFLQQLYQPMPIMIWIAIVIEAAIENWLDMGILLLIQVCACVRACVTAILATCGVFRGFSGLRLLRTFNTVHATLPSYITRMNLACERVHHTAHVFHCALLNHPHGTHALILKHMPTPPVCERDDWLV